MRIIAAPRALVWAYIILFLINVLWAGIMPIVLMYRAVVFGTGAMVFQGVVFGLIVGVATMTNADRFDKKNIDAAKSAGVLRPINEVDIEDGNIPLETMPSSFQTIPQLPPEPPSAAPWIHDMVWKAASLGAIVACCVAAAGFCAWPLYNDFIVLTHTCPTATESSMNTYRFDSSIPTYPNFNVNMLAMQICVYEYPLLILLMTMDCFMALVSISAIISFSVLFHRSQRLLPGLRKIYGKLFDLE